MMEHVNCQEITFKGSTLLYMHHLNQWMQLLRVHGGRRKDWHQHEQACDASEAGDLASLSDLRKASIFRNFQVYMCVYR